MSNVPCRLLSPSQTPAKTVFWFGLILSIFSLSSCASTSMLEAQKMDTASAPLSQPQMAVDAPAAAPPQAETTPKQQPQLIKKAQLTLTVESINQTTEAVTQIVKKQEGNILTFEAHKSPDDSQRQRANIVFRVPQARLENTLNAVAKLGTIENQVVTAEDVSEQLVDVQARLRNLRKSEEMVLKIMERSGSVGDVLNAANQLSSIRESIERIDAQLKSLQNQVAYSTVTLNLEAIASPNSTPENLGLKVQETWGKATHSVGKFTWALVALMLWLLAFSPYLLLVAGGVYGYYWYRHRQIK